MIARICAAPSAATTPTRTPLIRDTGFAEYGRTHGNRGAGCCGATRAAKTEFLMLSMLGLRDAIKAFAGEDIEARCSTPRTRSSSSGRARSPHYDVVDQV